MLLRLPAVRVPALVGMPVLHYLNAASELGAISSKDGSHDRLEQPPEVAAFEPDFGVRGQQRLPLGLRVHRPDVARALDERQACSFLGKGATLIPGDPTLQDGDVAGQLACPLGTHTARSLARTGRALDKVRPKLDVLELGKARPNQLGGCIDARIL
jgi:hypothetical protein